MTNKKILTLISFLLLFSFLMVGCTPNRPPEITSDPVTTATVGVDYTYNVVATDPDHDVLTYSLTIEPDGMLIDEDNGIITWTPDIAGDFDVTVEVSDGDLSDTQSFTITVGVAEVAVTGITLDKTTLALTVGGATGTLVETVVPATATDTSVTWASSAPAVATVALGVVTPVTAGTATITVKTVDGDFTDTCVVTVRDPEIELTGIVVDPKTMTLFAGGSEAIESVTATYEIKGYEIPIALGECTFASDDEAVATVSDVGLVTAVAEGTATITVSFGGKSDSLEVTVNPVLLTSIVVLPETMTLSVRSSKAITSVTAHYNDGSTAIVTLGDCTYESDDEDVATVLAGVISAIEVGTATITVTYAGMTDTLEVTVNSILLTSIVVLPETMTLLLLGSETLTSVTAHYSDGSETVLDLDACEYESSDTAVVTVLAGVISPVGFGTATITVTYTEEEITKTVLIEETDTVEVTVGPVYNITQGSYHDTIQAAIGFANTGDTIEVAAGTYIEDVTIGTIGVTLQAGTRHEAVIEGTVVITAYSVTVDGFYIKDFSQIPGPDWSGIYIPSGTGILVINNLIDGIAIDPVAFLTVGIHTWFGGTAEATLEGNTIRNVRMGIYNQGASLLIEDNTIEDTAHCGIGINTVLGTIITGNTISNCGLMGIEVFDPNVVANFNNITDNTNFGVWSAGPQVDATNNWWGDASGPTHLNNPGGTGDEVSNNVIYTPWSTVEN